MTCLAALAAPPPSTLGPLIGVLLFLILFPLLTALSSRLMGIPALYEAFPADPTDPIEERLGWPQVEFGGLRGHSPMAMAFGRRCLHLKQPFPFQPAWWRGPASIPWQEIRIEREAQTGAWEFWSPAVFQLGGTGRIIRLRGRAARRLQARVRQAQEPHLPPPALQPR